MADDERPTPATRESQGISWKLVLWGVIALYAVVFLLVNSKRSDVNFVFFTVRTRLIWLILLSMALGFVLGWAGPKWWRSRRRR